jgi:hypothetical protein
LGKSVRKGRETIAAYGAVMKSPELSLGAKVLWGIYRAYDLKGRGSWPGDETLAEHMGKSESSVQKYRRELLEKSFLKQTLRRRWPAIYRAVVPVYVLFPPPARIQPIQGGPGRPDRVVSGDSKRRR